MSNDNTEKMDEIKRVQLVLEATAAILDGARSITSIEAIGDGIMAIRSEIRALSRQCDSARQEVAGGAIRQMAARTED